MNRAIVSRATLGIMFLLALAALTNAKPERRVPFADELRLRFDKGSDFYLEMATETAQNMMVMKQEVKQKQEQIFVWHCQPDGQTKLGEWRLKMRMSGARMKIEIGGNRIDLDTAKPPVAGSDLLHKMVGAEFVVIIHRNGTVERVEGTEKFVNALIADNPTTAGFLKNILNDSAMKVMFAPLTNFLPDRPVASGDSWRKQWHLDLGGIARYTTDTKYVYQGTIGTSHRFRTITDLTVDKSNQPGAGLPFKIKNVSLETTQGAGELLFDGLKGRLVSSSQRIQMVGKLVVEIGNMETEVELDQIQVNRMRTLSGNPFVKNK